MSTLLVALSSALHVLATVVFVGYYVFLSLIYLPEFERSMQQGALRELLERISARLRPYFGGSLLIFVATGTYLMLINEHYLGLGNFFSNPWSALIVLKHAVVLVFLAVAVISERAFLGQISERNPDALMKFRWALNTNTLLGVLIIVLTSFAQVG
jgi:uncharacterized membrane protein